MGVSLGVTFVGSIGRWRGFMQNDFGLVVAFEGL